MQSTLDNVGGQELWHQIAPHLEEAMTRLRAADRELLALRFFENKTGDEAAKLLGIGAAAAHKRTQRALDKLQKFLSARGVSSTTAAIAEAVSANSLVVAPAGLAQAISVVAAAKGATASTTTLTLIKGALKIMAWTKAKTAIIASAVVLLTTGVTTVTVREIQEHRTYSWQVSKFDYLPVDAPTLLAKTLPQVTIVRSRFKQAVAGTPFTEGDSEETIHGTIIVHTNQSKSIGLGVRLSDIIKTAYDASDRRTIFAAPLPQERYDFIVNIAHGGFPALQEKIKKQFGVVGTWTMIETNVLALERIRQDVSFVPVTQPGANGLEWLRGSIENMVSSSLSVINATGLTNRYADISFKWPIRRTSDDKVYLGVLNEELRNQLGLELVPTNMPIEMLVVEKVK
ncbi:MAG TPA: sigma factor-like helix-turn-helix DNA-binding protein [Verrucomicrobiae bacterium]